MGMESHRRSYQVVLLGNAGVGKTTFFNQLKDGASPNVESTTDVCTKMYTFGEETVNVSGMAAIAPRTTAQIHNYTSY